MDKILDKKLDKHFGNFLRWGARAVRLLRTRRRTVLLERHFGREIFRNVSIMILGGVSATDRRQTGKHKN